MSNTPNRPRRSLLDGMADIVSDLWGESVPVQLKPVADAAVPAAAPVNVSPAPSAAPAYAPRPALPPFIELWKVADEPIDWTEALASPTPTDGLTTPDKWSQYHALAADVLKGDMTAYLNVLKSTNPMADLMPYVATLDVTTASADTLRASFTARTDLLEDNPREYMAGMALRIARDLFAVLPVSSVEVTGKHAAKPLLSVSFEKSELNKVRFSFIDPVEFVLQCGGSFTEVNA